MSIHVNVDNVKMVKYVCLFRKGMEREDSEHRGPVRVAEVDLNERAQEVVVRVGARRRVPPAGRRGRSAAERTPLPVVDQPRDHG